MSTSTAHRQKDACLIVFAQFSRNGQSFSTPDFSFKPHVQLPREHLKWLTAQPESVLSSSTVRSEGVAFEYMGRNRKANKISLKFVHAILNRCLTKNLDRLHADILDEVRASIDAELGFGDEVSNFPGCSFPLTLYAFREFPPSSYTSPGI